MKNHNDTNDSDESEQNSDGSACEGDSTDDENGDEIWDDVIPDELQRDLEADPLPLPNDEGERSTSVVHSLVFWFVYFLLTWQLSCHISDNGMAWLLRFLSAWLKVLGLAIPSETLGQLVIIFPSSLYMLRQFFNFDRDDFNKYVLCQKCHKL